MRYRYGRPGGWNKTHGTIGQHLCLDSFSLLSGDPPDTKYEGSVSWQSGSSISIKLEASQLTVGFAIRNDEQTEVVQHINLSRIKNGFGGNPRTYFICPFCGKRVQKLYLRWEEFRCRKCAELNYYSQQVTKGTDQCAQRMQSVLRKEFGITDSSSPMDMQYMTPPKPKWMRWETYGRKMIRLRKAQLDYGDAFIADALQFLGPNWNL